MTTQYIELPGETVRAYKLDEKVNIQAAPNWRQAPGPLNWDLNANEERLGLWPKRPFQENAGFLGSIRAGLFPIAGVAIEDGQLLLEQYARPLELRGVQPVVAGLFQDPNKDLFSRMPIMLGNFPLELGLAGDAVTVGPLATLHRDAWIGLAKGSVLAGPQNNLHAIVPHVRPLTLRMSSPELGAAIVKMQRNIQGHVNYQAWSYTPV